MMKHRWLGPLYTVPDSAAMGKEDPKSFLVSLQLLLALPLKSFKKEF